MEIFVPFDRAIQGLSNDTKFDIFDFKYWKVIVKKMNTIPEYGKRIGICPPTKVKAFQQKWTFSETNKMKTFVLDEADEMLSRGFKEQIYDVFKSSPHDVRVFKISLLLKNNNIFCWVVTTIFWKKKCWKLWTLHFKNLFENKTCFKPV